MFKTKIKLNIENQEYIVQKYEFSKVKGKVIAAIDPNCDVYFLGTKKMVQGNNALKKFKLVEIGSKVTKNVTCYVFPKEPKPISIPFHAGTYKLKLSNATMAKGEFAVVGRVTMNVADPILFANRVQKTITVDDFIESVEDDRLTIFKNEFQAVISQMITSNTTSEELIAKADEIIEKVYVNHGEVRSFFNDYGLSVNKNKFSLHINALNNTEENYNRINEATIEREVDDILNGNKDDVVPPFEGTITNDLPQGTKCPSCFQEVKPGVKFCPHCGIKLI